ncbi:hypothetical protein V6N12_024944 [Hibiscus sabdariffa]|uniref:CCHC-type domain-containing protein n=1 Tax=Hibiscus sabdariffa TaxID=183260 RepID=A0ABR2A5E0_9ROSI
MSLIEAIGSYIGFVVKIDYQIDYGCRGRFAGMAIKIILKQPLVSKIVINERTHNIEYESLLMVCFNCDIYGHISDHCPKTHPHEPSLESDATMIDTPIPQPP